MFGKQDPTAVQVTALEKEQNALTTKINLLQNEVRRLRDETALIDAIKKQSTEAKAEIENTLREINKLQVNIQNEIGKLSSKSNEILSVSQAGEQLESTGLNAGPPPPPPPPAPPAPPVFAAKPLNLGGSSKPKVETVIEKDQFNPNEILNTKLNSANRTGADQSTEQLQAEKIQRYEKSIQTKQREVEALILRVSEFQSKLITAQASQPEYDTALESQKELIATLKDKKNLMEAAFNETHAKVETELQKIVQKEEERKLKEASQSQVEEPQSVIPEAPAMNMPPPPPPPPAPLLNEMPKFRQTKQVNDKKSSKSNDAPTIDINALSGKINESKERRAQEESTQLLAKQLIDLALQIKNKEFMDINLEADQQKLANTLGSEGWSALKNILNEAIANLSVANKVPNPFEEAFRKKRQQASGKEDALAEGELNVEKLLNNKEKFPIIKAVSQFITSNANKDDLLKVSEEIKINEEKAAEAQRLAEEQRNIEAQAKRAEQEQLAKEKLAQENQRKLKGMNIAEGMVSEMEVNEAVINKVKVLDDISIKKTGMSKIEMFLLSLEDKLQTQIRILSEADNLREQYLNTISAAVTPQNEHLDNDANDSSEHSGPPLEEELLDNSIASSKENIDAFSADDDSSEHSGAPLEEELLDNSIASFKENIDAFSADNEVGAEFKNEANKILHTIQQADENAVNSENIEDLKNLLDECSEIISEVKANDPQKVSEHVQSLVKLSKKSQIGKSLGVSFMVFGGLALLTAGLTVAAILAIPTGGASIVGALSATVFGAAGLKAAATGAAVFKTHQNKEMRQFSDFKQANKNLKPSAEDETANTRNNKMN